MTLIGYAAPITADQIAGRDEDGLLQPLRVTSDGALANNNRVWDVDTLSWIPMQQPIVTGTPIVIGAVDQGLPGVLPWPVTFTPGSGSGYHKVAAASTNAANIKASAGTVYGIHVYNASGAQLFVKVFNKATAPTPGSDTPIRTVGVQAGQRADDALTLGLPCSLGIGIAIVLGIADNDSAAVAAGSCVVDLDYQ